MHNFKVISRIESIGISKEYIEKELYKIFIKH